MADASKYEQLPEPKLHVNVDKLAAAGIQPGVYEHYEGGEYLTLTTGWDMVTDPPQDRVGRLLVWYVALYEHPTYGPYAEWGREIDDFKNGTAVAEGVVIPKMKFLRPPTAS